MARFEIAVGHRLGSFLLAPAVMAAMGCDRGSVEQRSYPAPAFSAPSVDDVDIAVSSMTDVQARDVCYAWHALRAMSQRSRTKRVDCMIEALDGETGATPDTCEVAFSRCMNEDLPYDVYDVASECSDATVEPLLGCTFTYRELQSCVTASARAWYDFVDQLDCRDLAGPDASRRFLERRGDVARGVGLPECEGVDWECGTEDDPASFLGLFGVSGGLTP